MKNFTLIIALSILATILLIANAIPAVWWAYDTLLMGRHWATPLSVMLAVFTFINIVIQVGLHTVMFILGAKEVERRKNKGN